ncbi:hypothetical protein CYMTET_32793, partial [Cymbomonas tetramitiformis]
VMEMQDIFLEPRHRAQLTITMYSRIVDTIEFANVLQHLHPSAQVQVCQHLGWLNCARIEPDLHYLLHLDRPEEYEMARRLARMARNGGKRVPDGEGEEVTVVDNTINFQRLLINGKLTRINEDYRMWDVLSGNPAVHRKEVPKNVLEFDFVSSKEQRKYAAATYIQSKWRSKVQMKRYMTMWQASRSGAGMNRLQAQGGSALVVQMHRGSGGSARLRGPILHYLLWLRGAKGVARISIHTHTHTAEGREQIDGDGDDDGDEEAAHGGPVGWKEKWIRLLSFALARGVAGLIIRRAVGRCPAGGRWRWAGRGRVRGGMGPGLNGGRGSTGGVERLALMDRAWEDAFEETDYATQDGLGGGTQESGEKLHDRFGQAPGGPGEADTMASRLLESMEDVRREAEHLCIVGGQGEDTAEARSGGAQAASSVQDILAEWDDLKSPGPEGGVWTQEQSGASPEQAMALAEGGVATLMGASRRVAGLLGGVDGMGGTDEDDGGDVGRSAGGDDTRRAPQSPGAHPGSDDHLQQVARQHTASHQLPYPPARLLAVPELKVKFAVTSQGNQRKGSSHGELVLGVESYKRKSVADAQVWMRATQFIILSPLGQRLGILAVAWVGKLS